MPSGSIIAAQKASPNVTISRYLSHVRAPHKEREVGDAYVNLFPVTQADVKVQQKASNCRVAAALSPLNNICTQSIKVDMILDLT